MLPNMAMIAKPMICVVMDWIDIVVGSAGSHIFTQLVSFDLEAGIYGMGKQEQSVTA